ncbi:hypothetical protein [Crossiella cryophila]|uniref:Uncharacterized protein n=1 Tax=Crossiella cryophila TaxID=43355 RepID=A0A7W7FXX4_9PSEU|nr:hypothetical protein [Crossiella cryophila]MBB4681515.1 hypothetical protein [Crossiella cryophila]
MPLDLNDIPGVDEAPADARPTTALRRLDFSGSRRTLFKAIALGAVTVGASALNLFGARPAAAETGPYGLSGWDRNDCKDAYPNGYAEVGDTTGAYVNTYAACLSGYWRGSVYCEAGWHKYGTYQNGAVQSQHVPMSTSCGTSTMKNSWKWTTPDGKVWRCSDGHSTYWGPGHNGQTYLTICRALVQ